MERNRIFKSFNLPKYSSTSRHLSLKSIESSPILPKLKLQKHFSANLITTPNPSNSISQGYFPDWLLKRPDFKQILDPNSKDMEIGNICDLPDRHRDELQKKELLDWCQSCAFFQSFSQYTCKEVCSRLFTKRFHASELIIREGEIGDCMFIVVKGRVEIRKQNIYLDSVGQKNVIGETALESNCLRTATVIAKVDTTVLVLNKEDYHKVLSRQRHMLRLDIVNLLKRIPVFQDMMISKLERMAWRMLIMNYPDGHMIYEQQQAPNGVYFVKEGSINLFFDAEIKVKGKIPGSRNLEIANKTCTLLVKTVKKGDFFGEEELLDGILRKTKAVCAENSVLLFLNEKKFMKSLLDKEKELVKNVHEKVKSVKMLARECISRFREENLKKKAIFDATCVSGSKGINRIKRRKGEVAKSVCAKPGLKKSCENPLIKFSKELDEELCIDNFEFF